MSLAISLLGRLVMVVDSVFKRLGLSVAGRAMALMKRRQEYIASNIANADTPGYKARRFSFEKALQEAVYGDAELALVRTHPRHIPNKPSDLSEVEGRVYRLFSPLRNDGNSVDIDREMALLAENQLMYNSVVQGYTMQIGMLKYAVSGGRR